jgi:hypothetical protein
MPIMSFIYRWLRYFLAMRARIKATSNPVSAAASTAAITSGQNAGLSPEFKPTQDCPGSFTPCENCGLPIPGEISGSEIAALLDFFLILDRWDREARKESVLMSTWERF